MIILKEMYMDKHKPYFICSANMKETGDVFYIPRDNLCMTNTFTEFRKPVRVRIVYFLEHTYKRIFIVQYWSQITAISLVLFIFPLIVMAEYQLISVHLIIDDWYA